MPVLIVISAVITGQEALRIDGVSFPCTIITVVSHTPNSSRNIRTERLWIDKQTGVPLKRTTTYSDSSVTVAATHFASGETVPPASFGPPSAKGFLRTDDVFDNLLLAIPTNGPDFLFQSPGGSPVTLLTLTGTPALVSFGADDCAPCADDRTVFDATARKLHETGGRAVRVLTGDPTRVPPVESPNYTTIDTTPEQLDRLGIQILPSTMVMTPYGTIYRIQQGGMTEEKMLKLVESAKQQRVSPDASSYVAGTLGLVAPVPIFQPPVTLTSDAKALGLSGPVVLAVFVTKDGTVKKTTVTHSLHPIIDALASEAVQKWSFKPGVLDGRPVNVTIDVTVQIAR